MKRKWGRNRLVAEAREKVKEEGRAPEGDKGQEEREERFLYR